MNDRSGVTRDAVLGGRLTLVQPARGHRVGHDAILLAALARAEDQTILDFGAGVGGAGLAALVRLPAAAAILVEREPDIAALARANAAANGLDGRCHVICADVAMLNRKGGETLEPADLVLTNPPFNSLPVTGPLPMTRGRGRTWRMRTCWRRGWSQPPVVSRRMDGWG